MDGYGGNFPPKLSEPILRKNIKTACRIKGLKKWLLYLIQKEGYFIPKMCQNLALLRRILQGDHIVKSLYRRQAYTEYNAVFWT